MKCVPISFCFDRLMITENTSSSNTGMLSIENVPRNDLLTFSISLSIYTLLIPFSFILVVGREHLNIKVFSNTYTS